MGKLVRQSRRNILHQQKQRSRKAKTADTRDDLPSDCSPHIHCPLLSGTNSLKHQPKKETHFKNGSQVVQHVGVCFERGDPLVDVIQVGSPSIFIAM